MTVTRNNAAATDSFESRFSGMNREGVKGVLREQKIELPSWAFGNSGTRFRVFAQPGVPRDPYEKIADAAEVHKYTGVAPSVALHIPWDRVDDYAKLAAHAADLGVRIGAINSSLFQDDEYRLGSLTHPGRAVRHKAIAHHAECVEVMRQTGSADPFQLFRIMNEIVAADALRPEARVTFMLDQCHNIEPKIPSQIRSVMNVQEATAKALLVDGGALEQARCAGDVLGAHGVLMDAYSTDVRPLLAELRAEQGLDPDPMAAYAASGYAERIAAERVGGQQAGWGA